MQKIVTWRQHERHQTLQKQFKQIKKEYQSGGKPRRNRLKPAWMRDYVCDERGMIA